MGNYPQNGHRNSVKLWNTVDNYFDNDCYLFSVLKVPMSFIIENTILFSILEKIWKKCSLELPFGTLSSG